MSAVDKFLKVLRSNFQIDMENATGIEVIIDNEHLWVTVNKLSSTGEGCTGSSARWCPIHGDCVCKYDEEGADWETNPQCPLHGDSSSHAS